MPKNIGILLDSETGDLAVEVVKDANGLITSGLVIGDVTEQNQRTLLLSSPGEIKEDPLVGVGLRSFVESDDVDGLARKIRTEFTKDGMTVSKISVTLPNMEIEAKYE